MQLSTQESDTKEARSKTEKTHDEDVHAATENSQKTTQVSVVNAQESTGKLQLQQTKATEKGDKTALKVEKKISKKEGYGCDMGKNGKPMSLDNQERCSKDKAGELQDQEKQAKSV